jgi:hypothetical protein
MLDSEQNRNNDVAVENRRRTMAGQAATRLIAEVAEFGAIALFIAMVLVWADALTVGA